MSRKVFGQIGRLKKDKIQEYRKLHMDDVHTPHWEGVLRMIHDCNIRNYRIFMKDDLVFGYFEYVGDDYEAVMAKMEADEVTRQWWKLTRPCFTEYSASSKEAFYEDMDQIFDFAE